MFGSAVLEVAIGLTFFYLLFSVMCSAINEWISGILALRGENLHRGIANLLNDLEQNNAVEKIFAHPLIKSLAKPSRSYTLFGAKLRRPSYIPPKVFASVLIDLLAEKAGNQDPTIKDPHGLIANVRDEDFLNPDLRKTLMIFAKEAGNDFDQVRDRIEEWYMDAMDRVSGWYKRKAQAIIFLIAIILTAAVNADTLTIAHTLWGDSELRAQVAAMAEDALNNDNLVRQNAVNPSENSIDQAKTKFNDSAIALKQFPLGWNSRPKNANNPLGIPGGLDWLTKILGLLVTAFSVSLGAPFWFDLLSKLVKVRSSIRIAGDQREQA